MINLPISCPSAVQRSGVVAKYQTESEYIVLISARTGVILLTIEQARKYEADALGMCISFSSI